MSIHRTDRPDAPYRIRKSGLQAHRWIWWHDGCSLGDGPTREQAAALAAVHATTEHGASLDHLRSLMPALRAMGVELARAWIELARVEEGVTKEVKPITD